MKKRKQKGIDIHDRITDNQAGLIMFVSLFGGFFVTAFLFAIYNNEVTQVSIALIYIILVCTIFPLCLMWSKNDRHRKQEVQLRIQKIRKEEKIQAKKMAEEMSKKIRNDQIKDQTPVEATLLFTKNKYGSGSVLGMAAIGLAIGGPLCAAYGASKGAAQRIVGHEATFKVKYASGRIGTETVDTNSVRFDQLVKLKHVNE